MLSIMVTYMDLFYKKRFTKKGPFMTYMDHFCKNLFYIGTIPVIYIRTDVFCDGDLYEPFL